MSSKQQREQQKTLLLRQIQQQRLDLIASRRDWLEATAPFDRGWQTLLGNGRQRYHGSMVRSPPALLTALD